MPYLTKTPPEGRPRAGRCVSFSENDDEHDDDNGDDRADRIGDPSDLFDLLVAHGLIADGREFALAIRALRHMVQHGVSAVGAGEGMFLEFGPFVFVDRRLFHIPIIPYSSPTFNVF